MIDRWISLQQDWKNLAPMNLLSARQREDGGALNSEQCAATFHYLSTGKLPEGIEIGNSDSDLSITSDIENSLASSSKSNRTLNSGGFRSSGSNRSKGKGGSFLSIGSSANSIMLETQPNTPYTDLNVGQTVEVQDVFKTKLNEGVTVKWRIAQISSIDRNIVKIHFIGWESKWDEQLDIIKDRDRIRSYSGNVEKNRSISESTPLFKIKNRRKSASYYDRLKHLQTVKEVSERSSPSVSHSGSAVFSLGSSKNNTSGGTVVDALLQLPTSPSKGSSNLDAVIEDDTEGLRMRSTSQKEELSIDDKIRIAMEMADIKANNPATKQVSKLPNLVNSTKSTPKDTPKATPRGTLKSRRITIPVAAHNRQSGDIFKERLESLGLFIKQVMNDGNSLFRATSHQIHLTEAKHGELRIACVKHMIEHKKRFEMYCTLNFDQHVKRIAVDGCSGDELEIRVLEEVLDRTFHVYSEDFVSHDMKPVPMSINEDEKLLLMDVKPVKILFLGYGHYNSVVNELDPFEMAQRKTHVIRDARVELFRSICAND